MVSGIKTVGVVGAGTMGQGIAQVCAGAGYGTLLYDVNSSLATNAYEAIDKNLTTLVGKGKISEQQKSSILKNISIVTDLRDLKADLIIEAIVEKLEMKQKLFAELEQINLPSTILASNTSSIPITQIAVSLKRPENFVGLHFFNPAPVMKLVEVISGVATLPTVAEQMKKFSLSLEKTAVMVKDSPGFIVNRVARHYYVEALKLLEEGVASHEQIDALLRSTGFKMGPFELMDLIGVDVNLAVTTSLYNSFNQEHRFKPSPIQQQKVADGHLGKKTGKGFYEYKK
jgi:3-hydroxybutyryl-CoA dehydrogenase